MEELGIPFGARPQPNRVHRGKQSYTVETAVRNGEGGLGKVLVDVLLEKKAYYIKKCPENGRCGSVGWKKHGGPQNAWVVAMDTATCGGAAVDDS